MVQNIQVSSPNHYLGVVNANVFAFEQQTHSNAFHFEVTSGRYCNDELGAVMGVAIFPQESLNSPKIVLIKVTQGESTVVVNLLHEMYTIASDCLRLSQALTLLSSPYLLTLSSCVI